MKQREWKPRSKVRRILRRSSVVWWSAALGLGAITASIVSTNVGRATAAADAWGSSRPVWVVRRGVDAGDVVTASDVSLQQRPRAVVPAGALEARASPIGRATRVRLATGEVVLRDRVAGQGAVGVAAMLVDGRRAIALKSDESMPVLHAGDYVDVLATFDVSEDASGSEAPSFAVATNAEVLAVSSRTITLSVTSREAPRLAFALARAAITLSVHGA